MLSHIFHLQFAVPPPQLLPQQQPPHPHLRLQLQPHLRLQLQLQLLMQPQQLLLRPPLPLLLREQKAAHAPDRERPASLIPIVPNGVQKHHSLHALRRMIAVEVEPSAWLRHVIMQVQRQRQHLPRLLTLPYVPSAAMVPSVVQRLESVSLKALPLAVHVSLTKIRPFFCDNQAINREEPN